MCRLLYGRTVICCYDVKWKRGIRQTETRMFSLTVSYIENPQYNIAMVAFLHGRSGNRERERVRCETN